MFRTTAVGPAALAVSAVVVVGLLGGCGTETGGSGSGGRVVPGAGSAELTGEEFAVVVPSGEFTVTVGEPVEKVAADVAADGKSHTAPDGRRFVGIAWRPSGNAPASGIVLHGTDPLPATIGVRSDGRELSVSELAMDPADGPANGIAWVPVDDTGAAQLEIGYDGLTQVFDLATGERTPGPADGFYDIGTTSAECPSQGPGRDVPGLQYEITCQVSQLTSVPYVAGEGWADDGSTWLAFDLTLTPSPFRWSATGDLSHPYASYQVDAQSGRVESGRGEAVTLAESDLVSGVYTATVAVPAEADAMAEIEVVRTYELTRRNGDVGGAPDTRSVVYRGTVRTGR